MPISPVIFLAKCIVCFEVSSKFNDYFRLLKVPDYVFNVVWNRHGIVPFNQFDMLLVVEEAELLG